MKTLHIAILLLAMYGYGWVNVEAHTPCDIAEFREAPEPEPTCDYVLEVSPLSGELEAIYVCK